MLATLAQLVERRFRKAWVPSSNLGGGSRMKISRVEKLARREEKHLTRRIVTLGFLSAALIVFLLTLGIPILGKFADLLETISKREALEIKDKVLRPPILDDLPQATNSAKLKISGFADEAKSVDVYLGEDKAGETKVSDSRFSFEELTLRKGTNEISARSVFEDGKTSDVSSKTQVVFDNEEPSLTVEGPSDGQTFFGENRIKVSGKTDSDAQVTANGFLAVVMADGKFEVIISLSEGENTIEIKATDLAGNTKVEKRKVNFRK